MKIIGYDPVRHDFVRLVRTALDVEDLGALNAAVAAEPGWSIYKSMERTAPYRSLVACVCSTSFADRYAEFVRKIVLPLFDEAIYVQASPTPRIVYADHSGEPRFHRDCDYGHDPSEINFQVPLTPCFGSNAMWIESAAGIGDHRPVALDPGQMLMFDGATLSHGAVGNDTGRSRVSFDFRAVPASLAKPSHRGETAMTGPHAFVRYG